MAAIRGAGGLGALKSGSSAKKAASPEQPEPAREEDLAAAIRAALDARKGAVAGSGIIFLLFFSDETFCSIYNVHSLSIIIKPFDRI